MRHWVPSVLAQTGNIRVYIGGRFPIGQIGFGEPPGVLPRWPDAIAPCAFILVAGRGKGGAGQLFAVQAVVAFLRAILALGQRIRQRLSFKIIAKAGHIGGVDGGKDCHIRALFESKYSCICNRSE